jgi:hypothetical protein
MRTGPPEAALESQQGHMEPILGYRAWLADRDGRLRSLAVQDCWWEPGRWHAATCHRVFHRFDETDPGPAPHPANHPCGWHAYHRLDTLLTEVADLLETAWSRDLCLVRGVVKGGGRTQEHARGWRAQYAVPMAIIRFVPDDAESRSPVLLAQYAASERYGIPLIDPKEA